MATRKIIMNIKAQAILEFTFIMILMIFLIYGIVQVSHWTLVTTAEESIKAENISGSPSSLSVGVASMEMPSKPLDMMLQEKGK